MNYQITKAISVEFNKNEIIRLSKEMETEISRLTKAMESDIQLGIEVNNAVEKNKEIIFSIRYHSHYVVQLCYAELTWLRHTSCVRS